MIDQIQSLVTLSFAAQFGETLTALALISYAVFQWILNLFGNPNLIIYIWKKITSLRNYWIGLFPVANRFHGCFKISTFRSENQIDFYGYQSIQIGDYFAFLRQ